MTEFEKKFEEKTGENFNNYYKKKLPKLSHYLMRYTKNSEKAEEFADMAFIQGLEKIDTYNRELSQFITWLTSIAVNLVIKDYKDRQKFNLTSIDQEISENLTLNTFLKYDDDTEDKILTDENKAKCEIIRSVIYSLPDKYKKVMIMRELDKKPYKEIAETITKEYDINLKCGNYLINKDEYFHSAVVTNQGESEVKINFNSDGDGYTMILLPNEKKEIVKNELNNKIEIISENTDTNIKVTESTNLSTIKSQIKKGRLLIRKKVKKDFESIDKNGIK